MSLDITAPELNLNHSPASCPVVEPARVLKPTRFSRGGSDVVSLPDSSCGSVTQSQNQSRAKYSPGCEERCSHLGVRTRLFHMKVKRLQGVRADTNQSVRLNSSARLCGLNFARWPLRGIGGGGGG